MNYGLWHHQNALGNSAEQLVALSRLLKAKSDKNPVIYYEVDFQKCYALCIPNIEPKHLRKFTNKPNIRFCGDHWSISNKELFKNILMPGPSYPFINTYAANWKQLCLGLSQEADLKFPFDSYQNTHALPTKSIVVSIRERGTFPKRDCDINNEPHRFVNPQTFFDLALHYAEMGLNVVRIGDHNQTPMPKHKNILDFALVKNRTMMDDLFLLATCKVHLSTDSGVWPITAGMRSNLVFSNYCNGEPATINWLPKYKSVVIPKTKKENEFIDNTFEQLKTAVDCFI